ncbi:general substrate transporter [Xylariaceae sp. FL0804]|nr:general substrate transporter [Xylariaceae sp. FL0804]
MTWPLFLACFFTALLNISIPSFARRFSSQSKPDGTSIGSAGKFVGTFTALLLIERLGHRMRIWILCAISFVGVATECTAHTVAQFVVGRIIVYCRTYQSEMVPATLRGAVVGSIQLLIQHGQIFAAGINQRYSKHAVPNGWIIPVAMQAVVRVVVFLGSLFIPPAPRWLISKGRKAEAVQTLQTVRPREEDCEAQADAIEKAMNNKIEKGPWLDLFTSQAPTMMLTWTEGTNLRRTEIAAMVFILQQFTGQGFVSQYSPRFCKTVGLGEHASEHKIGWATVAWAGVLIGMSLVDILGRRQLLIWGAVLQMNPAATDANALVASVMLFNFFFSGTWAAIAYVIGSEIGNGPLREKTMALTSSINVVAAFLVAFCVPYMLDSIGSNIGWIFGGFSVVATIYAYFRVPEIMELDELFDSRVPARKFAATEIHGGARRLAVLENTRPRDYAAQFAEVG